MKEVLFSNMTDQERTELATDVTISLANALPRDTKFLLLLTLSDTGIPTMVHHTKGGLLSNEQIADILRSFADNIDKAKMTTVEASSGI